MDLFEVVLVGRNRQTHKGRGIAKMAKYQPMISSRLIKEDLKQRWANPVLKGSCPTCLRCFPFSAHLIQKNRLLQTLMTTTHLNQVCCGRETSKTYRADVKLPVRTVTIRRYPCEAYTLRKKGPE